MKSKDKKELLQNIINGAKPLAIRDNKSGKIIGILAIMSELRHSDIEEFLLKIRSHHKNVMTDFNIIRSNYCIEDYTAYELTTRESECLFYLLRGMTTKRIGDILKISPRTVEKFIYKIKEKLGCNFKSELIEKAISDGMLNIIPTTIDIKPNE